jgi:hypothetical protein
MMRMVLVGSALAMVLAACQSSDVSRAVGARCDRSVDCDDRCLGPSGDWPGGFCTIDCDSDDDCDIDAACIDEEGGGVCAFTCTLDAGCDFLGAGYTCKERDGHPAGAPQVTVCRG